jgi:hypothetical protein
MLPYWRFGSSVPVGAISTVTEAEGGGVGVAVVVGVGFGVGLGRLASTAAVLAMTSPIARTAPTPALAIRELIGLRIGRLPGLERTLLPTCTSVETDRFQALGSWRAIRMTVDGREA